MIFQERKIETGFHYTVEDIFGVIDIESSTKLEPDILDEMVVVLLRQNLNAREISGEVKHGDGIVKYVFKPRPIWEDDDEKNKCKDTLTSIKKQENASTQTRLSRIPLLNWFRRFAGAFREAWKKARSGGSYQHERDVDRS